MDTSSPGLIGGRYPSYRRIKRRRSFRATKQISDVVVTGQADDLSARNALLLWSQRTVEGYPAVRVRDFSASWRDGKAFLCILHSHRPDLVDFRRVNSQTPKENLDMAFTIAESEFGVTKLLDPEDVDVARPDERSLITYVSSLYDVFPEVPTTEQSLRDNERQLKWEEYRERASALLAWLRDATALQLDRNFPATLIEMKSQLADFNRFRMEEVPPRLHERGRLGQLFEEIQEVSANHGQFSVEDQLHFDNVSRLWDRFTLSQQEKEMAIHAEMQRLERIQRLAEKVHRECRSCEDHLEDIDRRIIEEEQRVDKIHPQDAKNSCDALQNALRKVEENIRNLFSDIQALKDGRYHQADQMYRRVYRAHQRWLSLKAQLQNELLPKMTSRSLVQEGASRTRRTEIVTSVRLVETNEAFRHVQQVLDWIQNKQIELEGSGYGSDLETSSEELDNHKKVHAEIVAYKQEVTRCFEDKRQLDQDEQKLYQQYLSKVEFGYPHLTSISNRRMNALESLEDFLRDANTELMWLSEREEKEISRDWSAKGLNTAELQKYYESLMRELEGREAQFRAVGDKGETLVMEERHPATKTIEAYMTAMQTQWAWLLQLTACLDTHLKNSSKYHQFFQETQDAEQWIRSRVEALNSHFNRSHVRLEEGEKLIREIQEMREQVNQYADTVEQLTDRSQEVVPLKMRSQRQQRPRKIIALCTYKQLNMSISKREDCLLLDNSQRTKWRVRNSVGIEGLVPAVCFLVPPPDQEATDYANLVRRDFEELKRLWRERQRTLKQQMIFATINVVKQWDLKQFLALGPTQREAIMTALNEDAESLIGEYEAEGARDPALQRLQEEIKQCNRHYHDLLSRSRDQDEKRSPSSKLADQLEGLRRRLDQLEHNLHGRLQEALPRDLQQVEPLVVKHKEFENNLQAQENGLGEAQDAYQSMSPSRRTPEIEARYSAVVEKWDHLWAMSHIYVERLKSVEIVLTGLDDLNHSLADYERQLASQDIMTSNVDALQTMQYQLKELMEKVEEIQRPVNQLSQDMMAVKQLVARSRPGMARSHPDVQRMEKDVDAVVARWENLNIQAADRLHNVEDGLDLLVLYQNGLNTESPWISRMQRKVRDLPSQATNGAEARAMVEPTVELYNELKERRPQIEALNRNGGKFVKEAKVKLDELYEQLTRDLRNQRNWLSDAEQALLQQEPASESKPVLDQQLDDQKALYGEIVGHQQPILSLVYQAQQLLEHNKQDFTEEQLNKLESLIVDIRKKLESVYGESENRVRALTTVRDEQQKFDGECGKFDSWISEAENELRGKQRVGGDIERLRAQAEQHKAFVDDIVAHAADLRFINMAAQRFLDEATCYQKDVKTFANERQKSPKGKRSTNGVDFQDTREKVRGANERYQNLKSNSESLMGRLQGARDRQKEYNEAVYKMQAWLLDAENKAKQLRSQPIGTEPLAVAEQLDAVKAFSAEVFAQTKHLDELKRAARNLGETMRELGADDETLHDIEELVNQLADRHGFVTAESTARSNVLQTALVQSQGVQEGLDSLLAWLRDTESTLTAMRPISLNQELLNDQMSELQVLKADIESHIPSVESVNKSGSEVMTSSDPEVAQVMGDKLADLNNRFEAVALRCKDRSEDLQEVVDRFAEFQDRVHRFNDWLVPTMETLESRETAQLEVPEFKEKLTDIANDFDIKVAELTRIRDLGQDMVRNPKTGDVTKVKETMAECERNWHELNDVFADKEKEAKYREEKSNCYDKAREDVTRWLTNTETTIDTLEPVAIDVEIIARQIEEIQPLLRSYEEYNPKIDEVNELGNTYDALQRGEPLASPIRRKNRRFGRNTLSSPIRQAPSPTTALSPSSESSGISSRKSSSDNLLASLDDMSEVQRQLVGINQRYDVVGERLADRQRELESTLENVRMYLTDLQEILQWLEEREESTGPLEGILPTQEDTAKAQLKDHQTFHDELMSKEPVMAALKSKAHELMKNREHVPGMKDVKKQLKQLEKRWKSLKQVSEERRKSLEGLVEDLRDSRESYDQLTAWLGQKEKMVSILGPTAAEPAMVNNQLQQVQLLQEEMNSQQPQYEQFLQASHSILEKCDPNSDGAEQLNKKLDEINKSWDKIQGRLNERETTLKDSLQLSTKFYDVLQALSDWLPGVTEQLEALPPVSSQTDVVTEQKEELNAISTDVDGQRPKVDEASKLCKQLCDMTKESSTKFDLKNKLGTVEKPYNDICKKIDERRKQLDGAVVAGQKFWASLADMMQWVVDKQQAVDTMAPVSGQLDVLNKQNRDSEALQNEISNREPSLRLVLDKGQHMLDTASPMSDVSDINDQLEGLRGEWKKLRTKVGERDAKLKEANKHAERFNADADTMLAWLNMNEDKLSSVGPVGLDKDVVAKQLKEAQAMQTELLRKTRDQEGLNAAARGLVGNTEADHTPIQETLEDINNRWDKLNNGVLDRVQDLEDMSQKLQECDDILGDLSSNLRKYEDKVKAHLALGPTAREPKHMDKLKALQEEVSSLKPQMEHAHDFTDSLLADTVDGEDTAAVTSDLRNLADRYGRLVADVEGVVSDLESGSQIVGKLQGDIRGLSNGLSELEEDLDHKSPAAREADSVNAQIEDVLSFKNLLHDKLNDITDLENQCRQLTEDGYLSESEPALEQVDGLKKQHNKLKERAQQRESELGAVLDKLTAFHDDVRQTSADIDNLLDTLVEDRPIGGEVKVIQQQQEEFKRFLKERVDPIHKDVDKTNKAGQGLIQSASPTVNCSQLESDLEDLNNKYLAVQEKVQSHDRRLDTALLQSGKFKDALASLMEWLKETEDLVDNQKSPSSDYKVVKAQMQEQKFLQRMLDDRKPGIQSVQDIGSELMRHADDAERQQVDEQLKELTKRWGHVNQAADDRKQALEKTMELAKEFHDKVEPLMDWMDTMEKKTGSLEPPATETSKIKEQMEQQKGLSDSLAEQKPELDDVLLSGQQLLKQSGGDEQGKVHDMMESLADRYRELQEKAASRTEALEEALPLATQVKVAHDKFLELMQVIEPELRGKEPVGPEAEMQVEKLQQHLASCRPFLEDLERQGSTLSSLSPGDGASKLDELVNKDKKKFGSVQDQVQKRADRIMLQRQKSVELIADIDDLLEWFGETEHTIQEADPISSNPDMLRAQLRDHKTMNDDINGQKSRARDLVSASKRIRRESSSEEDPSIKEKLDDLKTQTDSVTKLSADRLSLLEQATPLAAHFHETHSDLIQSFNDIEEEIRAHDTPAVNTEQIKDQQDAVRLLKQSIADKKPLVDRLTKTGNALLKLVGEEEGDQVQTIMDGDTERYERIRDSIRDRSNKLEEALHQTLEFSDKLEGMLETLTTTAEQVEKAEPISAHPDKLREQISDNVAIVEDLDKRLTALEAVASTAEDLLNQTGMDDESAKELRDKVNDLVGLYDKIKSDAESRNQALENTLGVSEKFWDDLNGLVGTLKDLQDTLVSLEPPSLDPKSIRQQQDMLEALREDIEHVQPDMDVVHEVGEELIGLIGEPDKPEVEKNVDDLDGNWQDVTSQWATRQKLLDEALRQATSFQEELMKILVWLQGMEERLAELGPIGMDVEVVKQQLTELRAFKDLVHPKHLDIQSLNQQAQDLTRDSPTEQGTTVREPMSDVNKRWDALIDSISERKTKLQSALLNLGQFQSAVDELLGWLERTERTLAEGQLIRGDPRVIEIELAKHRILMNDIGAHQASIDSVNDAGKEVISSEGGADATTTRQKVDDMNTLWDAVLSRARDRQLELQDALREAKSFHDEMQDMLIRLSEIDGQLITAKPVGGLPETAKEQLEKFMEVFTELGTLEPRVDSLLQNGEALIEKSSGTAANTLRQNSHHVKTRWDNIRARAKERKTKLEEAVNQAGNFHDDLNRFIGWLTEKERHLNNLKPASRVMDNVLRQVDEHQGLQKDISAHREVMVALDKTGTHLKYFSQKQDVILIKNLLSSVQHRWEKVVSRCAERTRQLDHGYKEAKQFHEAWRELLDWLTESENQLESDLTISNDAEKIKAQIAHHKDFQRTLGAKQPAFDNANRMGRRLKDKCPKPDVPAIQEMLNDLKLRWNNICAKSVDRQRKLEESLLFSGQFKEALAALLDWLYKVAPGLAEDQPVHGDLDTVNALVEEHHAFQHELGKRQANIATVKQAAREMMDKSEEDHSHLENQLIELTTMWDKVCKQSVRKQERLDEAQKDAEEFHKKTHSLLDWLAQAERHLRYQGALPDDQEGLLNALEDHKKLLGDLAGQEAALQECLRSGQDILKQCHPDAVTTVKHWLTILQARWEEVTAWARQREQKLEDGLTDLKNNASLLDQLMSWLMGGEATLLAQGQQPIPENIPIIEQLLHDHQTFQSDITARQPEVERLTKTNKQRPAETHIPMARRRISTRRTLAKSDGTKTPEPEFKNPRVGALFNKWRQVWLMSMDRQRQLQDMLDRLNESEKMRTFEFDDWRKRYMRWMNNNKSRVMDFFRKQDRDHDGKVTRKEFIDGIMASKFPTTRMEMEAVADIFDSDGDGYIDYKEFVNALKPDSQKLKPPDDNTKILDEVRRACSKCTCVKQFRIHKIGEGKYRFGESQKLRLVRILRSTVMVRVGGGWVALDEFLVKNDPCRAKGRTNLELREQFILADGVSQSMAHFVPKTPSRGSPSTSTGSQSSTVSGWSGRSASSASGPITKIREKTQHGTPWRQTGRPRVSPDTEVRNIMSPSVGGARPRTPVRCGIHSPGGASTPSRTSSRPNSRPSSRASSRSSRPPSVCSDASEEPEIFTTVKTETKNAGGRQNTTVTYQTHQTQMRTVPVATPTKSGLSRIPKPSSTRKKPSEDKK